MPDNESIIAFEIAVCQADGVNELIAAIDISLHRMDTRLAIILRTDGHALGDELLTQLDIIHHVPIMRPDHVPIRIQMGLAIDLRWLAKCGPAQLCDAALSAHFSEVVLLRHSFY